MPGFTELESPFRLLLFCSEIVLNIFPIALNLFLQWNLTRRCVQLYLPLLELLAVGKCNSVCTSCFFTTPESCACCLGHSWIKHFLSSSPNEWVICLCKLQRLNEILTTQGPELAVGLWLWRGNTIVAVITAESFQPTIVHRQYVHFSLTKELMHFFLMWKWFYPFEMLMSRSVLFVLCKYSFLLYETFSIHLLLTTGLSLPLSLMDNPLAFFCSFVLFLL